MAAAAMAACLVAPQSGLGAAAGSGFRVTSSAFEDGGILTAKQAADDPMADKPAEKPKSAGICPCCRNMAMMRGGAGMGGGGGMQHHNMPGMDMSK